MGEIKKESAEKTYMSTNDIQAFAKTEVEGFFVGFRYELFMIFFKKLTIFHQFTSRRLISANCVSKNVFYRYNVAILKSVTLFKH